MNKEVMQKWVEALRSGKYKQAKGRLKLKDSYCCLGVLCDLAGEDYGYFEQDTFHTEYDNEEEILPNCVSKWADMSSLDGALNPDNTLASLNDAGKTFNEIADIIEANYERL